MSGNRPVGRYAGQTGALLVALTAVLASAAAAQEPPGSSYAGKTITSVSLEEEQGELIEPGLLDLVETRPGDSLSLLAVRDSIARLIDVGQFEDVRVDATADGNGVALRYRLVPQQAISKVEFLGDLGLSKGRLAEAIRDRFGGEPPAIGRVHTAAGVLEDLYAGYGYMRAQVTPSVAAGTGGRSAVLVFRIEAGQRATIGDINVVGQSRLSAADLVERFQVRWGGFYDRRRLEERLAAYVADLRDRGYYEASASHDTTVVDDGRTLELTLSVEDGPFVTVGFEGDLLPADQRRELVPIAREGSVDEDLLEDSGRRIEQYLHEQGFWRAAVSHQRTQQDDRLSIVFTVRRGAQYRVSGIEIVGNEHVPDADLRPLVRLKPGEPFVASVLDADMAAVVRLYLERGYSQVSVRTEVDETPLDLPGGPAVTYVTPRVIVAEGPRTFVAAIDFEGNQILADSELRTAIASRPDGPFVESQAVADRDALSRLYLNRGYQDATVQVDRESGESETSVRLIFVLREGQQTVVDHVIIIGNTRTSTQSIREELPLKPGDPIGLDDLIEAQGRLAALGLFRRVNVRQLEDCEFARCDLLVTVEEAPATTISYGGGVEAGQRLRSVAGGSAEEFIDISPRGFFEVTRRNLWGKNRSVSLFARVSVRRSEDSDTPQDSGLGFNEYRVVGSYREPRAFGTHTDVLVNGFVEQGVRTSFNFSRKGVTGEASAQLAPRYRLSGRYSFGYTRLFDERLAEGDKLWVDRLFPDVRLSILSLSIVRDTRDDPIDPSEGTWVALDGELAVRSLGSEVGFAKTYLQGFAYRRLNRGRRVVLALGARLGLATGFPRDVTVTDEDGTPALDANGQPVVRTVTNVPASERFFAGGDTTVRGFAIDRLGTPETIDEQGFPIGGHGFLVFNAEVRIPLWQNIGVVGFLDGGNVFDRAGSIDLAQLRGSVGLGLRYQSPIGPLRVDYGIKMDRRVVAGTRERLTALHVGFGQAF